MFVLEVGGGDKVGDSSNVSVGGEKFLFEFSMKVYPVNKSVRLQTPDFLPPNRILRLPTSLLVQPLCKRGHKQF